MRVLITGARGQVGRELTRLAPQGFEALGLGSAGLDITSSDAVNKVVTEMAPDLIINAAAYTAVDKAESDSEQAYAVNELGVRHLAQAAAASQIPVFHISTDYVFDGSAIAAYCETDVTAPTGIYGASKLAGEKALAEICDQHIILRTSWVFGQYGHNFVKTMLRLGAERDSLGVVSDQKGAPTGAASIAQALWQIAERYKAGHFTTWGTYHYSGAPDTSWYEFALEIFKQASAVSLIARVPTVNPIATADYPTPAKRPANSVLNCVRINDAFNISQPDWREDLKSVLEAL